MTFVKTFYPRPGVYTIDPALGSIVLPSFDFEHDVFKIAMYDHTGGVEYLTPGEVNAKVDEPALKVAVDMIGASGEFSWDELDLVTEYLKSRGIHNPASFFFSQALAWAHEPDRREFIQAVGSMIASLHPEHATALAVLPRQAPEAVYGLYDFLKGRCRLYREFVPRKTYSSTDPATGKEVMRGVTDGNETHVLIAAKG